mmetsp:Transcript_2246/g.2515  ORF Transcript_2246/g.2515 Transcript_2246/m.2515 type:complete len:297 (+) Transcript_2246:370-1260(+)
MLVEDVQLFAQQRPKLTLQYFREASILSMLNHDNIVSIHDSWLENDSEATNLFIQMDLCTMNLDEFRRSHKSREDYTSKALECYISIARALAYLHSKRICHRDVKMKNCMIGEDNKTKLCDFGTSRYLPPVDPSNLSPTEHYFASPEQRSKKKSPIYDQSADIFLFAMMGMDLFAAPGCEDAVDDMMDSFVPDYDSFDWGNDDGGEEEVDAQGAVDNPDDEKEFNFDLKALDEDIELPDTSWWHENMIPGLASHLSEILPLMLEPGKPSDRPSAEEVANRFVDFAASSSLDNNKEV